MTAQDQIVIVGAGIAGLSAALRLASAGRDVLVVERADTPGGKLRTVPSAAGPVDAGPTVMTLLPVFQRLFADAGLVLEDHLTIHKEPLLARHWWPDGSTLDLFADQTASSTAIREFAGQTAQSQFDQFSNKMRRLFTAFEGPVMQSARPDLPGILGACLSNPDLMPMLMPGQTMARMLQRQFSDPRLRQLFGRYATYVGGSPYQSPALLALIWHAEASGIGLVEGGMHRLAQAVEAAAKSFGAQFSYGSGVAQICPKSDGTFSVILENERVLSARSVLFNGDPRALGQGLLGPHVTRAVPKAGTAKRALSAFVWSFAATPKGRDLAHHNVFFNQDYRHEFNAIDAGRMPTDATLYVCAQDRHAGFDAARNPGGAERFEIIMNGAPVTNGRRRHPQEYPKCLMQTFETLTAHGLDFNPLPEKRTLTSPHDFAKMFPGSAGSLYGRSPHGLMASFQRPVIRSKIPGLYLAGGGVHPGAGIPMAATSGRLAAEAILNDRASTWTFRRMAMRGGMSTDYPIAGPTVSRSSRS